VITGKASEELARQRKRAWQRRQAELEAKTPLVPFEIRHVKKPFVEDRKLFEEEDR